MTYGTEIRARGLCEKFEESTNLVVVFQRLSPDHKPDRISLGRLRRECSSLQNKNEVMMSFTLLHSCGFPVHKTRAVGIPASKQCYEIMVLSIFGLLSRMCCVYMFLRNTVTAVASATTTITILMVLIIPTIFIHISWLALQTLCPWYPRPQSLMAYWPSLLSQSTHGSHMNPHLISLRRLQFSKAVFWVQFDS